MCEHRNRQSGRRIFWYRAELEEEINAIDEQASISICCGWISRSRLTAETAARRDWRRWSYRVRCRSQYKDQAGGAISGQLDEETCLSSTSRQFPKWSAGRRETPETPLRRYRLRRAVRHWSVCTGRILCTATSSHHAQHNEMENGLACTPEWRAEYVAVWAVLVPPRQMTMREFDAGTPRSRKGAAAAPHQIRAARESAMEQFRNDFPSEPRSIEQCAGSGRKTSTGTAAGAVRHDSYQSWAWTATIIMS